jgi:hypothetical protein
MSKIFYSGKMDGHRFAYRNPIDGTASDCDISDLEAMGAKFVKGGIEIEEPGNPLINAIVGCGILIATAYVVGKITDKHFK